MKLQRKTLLILNRYLEYNQNMEHILAADEFQDLVSGKISMIARSFSDKSKIIDLINPGDKIYFVSNRGINFIIGQALVKNALVAKRIGQNQLLEILRANQNKLNFNSKTIKLWAKKSNIMFVELTNVRPLKPFAVAASGISRLRPWAAIGYLNKIRIS